MIEIKFTLSYSRVHMTQVRKKTKPCTTIRVTKKIMNTTMPVMMGIHYETEDLESDDPDEYVTRPSKVFGFHRLKNAMFSMLYSIIPCLFYLEQKLIEQKNENEESDDDSTMSDCLIAEVPKVSSGKG